MDLNTLGWLFFGAFALVTWGRYLSNAGWAENPLIEFLGVGFGFLGVGLLTLTGSYSGLIDQLAAMIVGIAAICFGVWILGVALQASGEVHR